MSDFNVRTVLVSLHGDKETHSKLTGRTDAYDMAIGAIKTLLSQGIEVVAEATLVQDNYDLILQTILDVYQLGVREFRVMRYVATGKNDEAYAIPIEAMLPLMKKIKNLQQSKCPNLNVGWPCGQKFCTSTDDSPLHEHDESLNLRFEQLTGHCSSGLSWGSISYDGKLRNCPHSNVYHASLHETNLEDGWRQMTARVEEAITTRISCSSCSVLNVCKGGCHLPHFIETEVKKLMV